MPDHRRIYRRLQQHLDRQAVGFPPVRSGADLRLLQRLFSPEEAKLALALSFRPLETAEIIKSINGDIAPEEVPNMLNSMFMKGAIGRREKANEYYWFLAPLVVGMYEFQDGKPSRGFLKDATAYMSTLAFGRSFVSVRPSQMRTIPVHKSIRVEHRAAPFDQLREIISAAHGPFVILNCICRERMKALRTPCKKTARTETCLGFDSMGKMVLARGHGREINRAEAIQILEENEKDGLVLQPSGAQGPEFICSCCGCCCGMLAFQKHLPHPVDFWTSSFYAQVTPELCSGCKRCIERCQVGAVAMKNGGPAVIDLSRCIGCGLCVTTCSKEALQLIKKEAATIPPPNDESLSEEIFRRKRNKVSQWLLLLQIALRRRVF